MLMPVAKKILFDAERMKYPNTGLYHFCYQLSKALIHAMHETDMQLQVFGPASCKVNFSENTDWRPVEFWHKFLLPTAADISVWHTSNQDSEYFPFGFKNPILFTIHDLNYYHDQRKPLAKRKAWLQAVQAKVNASSYISFISQHTFNDVQGLINLTNKPTAVIYNGCNITGNYLLTNPQYQPAKPFIFSIGTIAEKKNFHVLPALLCNNEYELVIAGITQQEWYKQKIMDEAIALGVEDRIVFTGPVSENDKQWYYANCAAFLFPSLVEGFGLPVVEAMYFGKPIFISNNTSLPEIGGDAVYIFNSFDLVQMQERFNEGLKDYAINNRVEQIKKRAQFFNWQTAAEQYVQIYQQLIATK